MQVLLQVLPSRMQQVVQACTCTHKSQTCPYCNMCKTMPSQLARTEDSPVDGYKAQLLCWRSHCISSEVGGTVQVNRGLYSCLLAHTRVVCLTLRTITFISRILPSVTVSEYNGHPVEILTHRDYLAPIRPYCNHHSLCTKVSS